MFKMTFLAKKGVQLVEY